MKRRKELIGLEAFEALPLTILAFLIVPFFEEVDFKNFFKLP
jgi:hypothetical protein